MSIAGDSTRDYDEIARVGRLWFDGSLLTWDVKHDMKADTQSFRAVFQQQLRRSLPDSGLTNLSCENMCYWVCKSLSANYVLAEVMTKLRALLEVKEDALIKLCMSTEEGAVVDYCVDVLSRLKKLRVSLKWHGRGNVVEITPDGEHVERGTLSSIHTEFDFSPKPGSKPVYHLCVRKASRSFLGRRRSVHILQASDALSETHSSVSGDSTPSTSCTQCASCHSDMSLMSEGSEFFDCDECEDSQHQSKQPDCERVMGRRQRALQRCRTWMHAVVRGRASSDQMLTMS